MSVAIRTGDAVWCHFKTRGMARVGGGRLVSMGLFRNLPSEIHECGQCRYPPSVGMRGAGFRHFPWPGIAVKLTREYPLSSSDKRESVRARGRQLWDTFGCELRSLLTISM